MLFAIQDFLYTHIMYFVMSTRVKKTLWGFVQMSKIISMLLILLLHITLIFIIIIVCDILANHDTTKTTNFDVRMYLNYTYIMEQMYLPGKPLRSAVLICLFCRNKKRYEKCEREIATRKRKLKISFLEFSVS